jgi:uncharacterized protein with PhoU and TrkA domain
MAEDPFGPADKNSLRKFAVEVRKLEDRVKQLEDRIHRAGMAFFRDGSDGQVASGMLAILEEERNKS